MLLGDGDLDLNTVSLVTIPSLISGAVVWWVGYEKQRRNERRAELKEDTDQAVARVQTLLDRVERDRKDAIDGEKRCQERMAEMQEQIRKTDIKAERAITWIYHAMVLLDEKNVRYPPWIEDTAVHVALGHPVTPVPEAPRGGS